MDSDGWELLFVLPHLTIDIGDHDEDDRTLGLGTIGIVRGDDPRVRSVASSSEPARLLLSAYRNEYGEAHIPAVLVAHRDLTERLGHGSAEPYVAFRNTVALSDVLLTRASSSGAWSGRSWTDSYDFHSAQLATDGSRVDFFTPATSHFHAPVEHMQFTTDPGLPRNRAGMFDREFGRRLAAVWVRRYLHKKQRLATGRVFRSLEIAYHAASVRFKNFGSIHEAGLSAILWASAVDVLAGQAVSWVDRWAGLDLVGEFRWSEPRLRRRAFKLPLRKRGGPSEKGNLVQRSYSLLYEARNRFVHGNPVTRATLRPFAHPKAPPLLSVASTVYRTALIAYLDRLWPTADDSEEALNYLTAWAFEDHLLSAVTGRSDD